MIKLPKKISYKKAKQFFKSIGLGYLNDLSINEIRKKKDHRYEKSIHKPEIVDLYRIYKLITLNKRINVLEYGTGYSSLVISKEDSLHDQTIFYLNEKPLSYFNLKQLNFYK